MQMLDAGGYPCKGTHPGYEPFGVGSIPWNECEGHAVKVVDAHSQLPPPGYPCRVIRLRRDLKQQAKSIHKWANAFGFGFAFSRSANKALIAGLQHDYRLIDKWARDCQTLVLDFERLITEPKRAAERLCEWIDEPLDTAAMAACVIDRAPECHREMLELGIIERAAR